MLLHSLTAASLFFTSTVLAQAYPPIQCPADTGVHIVAVSGDGATLAPFQYGLIGNLTRSILALVPGSTNISIPYDKNATNKLISTTQGSVNFTNYVNLFHHTCPCSKVAVIGYSSGAIIAMNSICGASSPWTSPAMGFNSSYADFIVGIVAYGDETRTAGLSYDYGNCTSNGRFPRTAANAACPLFAGRIQSYCDASDPECCMGTVNATHYVYDLEYDAMSSQFIKSRVAAFPNVCTTSTSSSTHPPSTTSPIATTVKTMTSTHVVTVTATPTSKTCPTALAGNWQFPHLIVPVNSAFPNTAYSTSYDGLVNSTDSSIFNFDIPASYAGLTCTVFFDFPLLSQLKYSSYTTSGAPGVSFALLNGVASMSTTYANMPPVGTNYGSFTMTPGTNVIFASGPCAANTRVSYLMSATGNYALDYFQSYSSPPIGVYLTAC